MISGLQFPIRVCFFSFSLVLGIKPRSMWSLSRALPLSWALSPALWSSYFCDSISLEDKLCFWDYLLISTYFLTSVKSQILSVVKSNVILFGGKSMSTNLCLNIIFYFRNWIKLAILYFGGISNFCSLINGIVILPRTLGPVCTPRFSDSNSVIMGRTQDMSSSFASVSCQPGKSPALVSSLLCKVGGGSSA